MNVSSLLTQSPAISRERALVYAEKISYLLRADADQIKAFFKEERFEAVELYEFYQKFLEFYTDEESDKWLFVFKEISAHEEFFKVIAFLLVENPRTAFWTIVLIENKNRTSAFWAWYLTEERGSLEFIVNLTLDALAPDNRNPVPISFFTSFLKLMSKGELVYYFDRLVNALPDFHFARLSLTLDSHNSIKQIAKSFYINSSNHTFFSQLVRRIEAIVEFGETCKQSPFLAISELINPEDGNKICQDLILHNLGAFNEKTLSLLVQALPFKEILKVIPSYEISEIAKWLTPLVEFENEIEQKMQIVEKFTRKISTDDFETFAGILSTEYSEVLPYLFLISDYKKFEVLLNLDYHESSQLVRNLNFFDKPSFDFFLDTLFESSRGKKLLKNLRFYMRDVDLFSEPPTFLECKNHFEMALKHHNDEYGLPQFYITAIQKLPCLLLSVAINHEDYYEFVMNILQHLTPQQLRLICYNIPNSELIACAKILETNSISSLGTFLSYLLPPDSHEVFSSYYNACCEETIDVYKKFEEFKEKLKQENLDYTQLIEELSDIESRFRKIDNPVNQLIIKIFKDHDYDDIKLQYEDYKKRIEYSASNLKKCHGPNGYFSYLHSRMPVEHDDDPVNKFSEKYLCFLNLNCFNLLNIRSFDPLFAAGINGDADFECLGLTMEGIQKQNALLRLLKGLNPHGSIELEKNFKGFLESEPDSLSAQVFLKQSIEIILFNQEDLTNPLIEILNLIQNDDRASSEDRGACQNFLAPIEHEDGVSCLEFVLHYYKKHDFINVLRRYLSQSKLKEVWAHLHKINCTKLSELTSLSREDLFSLEKVFS